jgi:Putative zinc-finger
VAQLTDETLMAYADGELDPATRAQVEAALADDPRARQQLEIFKATGSRLADLFNKPMREPVPADLLALLTGGKPVGNVRRRRWRLFAMDWAPWGVLFDGAPWVTAAAWSIPLLLLAAGIVWYLRPAAGDLQQLVTLEQGQIFARGPLKTALETAPSGATVTLGGSTSAFTMEALLTFKNRRQNFCRQYDVSGPDSSYAGIACRGEDGRWRLELHIAVAPHSAPKDKVVPAGKGSSAVEAAVNSVIEGDALGRDEEEALIRNGWR